MFRRVRDDRRSDRSDQSSEDDSNGIPVLMEDFRIIVENFIINEELLTICMSVC